MREEEDFKIDIVYMWVDGRDPKWRAEKEYWAKQLGVQFSEVTNRSRFCDNQELRYSLRSVETNMPWINKIFIVTNGQVPEWLDTTHPKIEIINHSEIMPSDALPTFNSRAIEFSIANIPGLSEHFILANDDCFIYKPVKPSFFFKKDGKPIVRLKRQVFTKAGLASSVYYRAILYSRQLIEEKYGKYYEYAPQHNPDSYTKTEYLNCIHEFQEEFDRAVHSRFRSETVQRVLFALYMLANKKCHFKFLRSKPIRQNESMYIDLTDVKSMSKKIKKRSPKLLCINDESSATDDQREKFKLLMAKMFPNVAPWEKADNFCIPSKNSDISIAFSVTREYAKYFGVALHSLIQNSNPKLTYDIVVLDHDIAPVNKIKLSKMVPDNFSLRFVDISIFLQEKLKDFNIKSIGVHAKELYDKLFIPLLFKDYKRILYLDSDVCVNDNLADLFNINLNSQPLGAIKNYSSWLPKWGTKRKLYIKEYLHIDEPENYFNTGVLLFDNEKFDLKEYYKKLKRVSGKIKFYYPAEEILNVVFNEKTEFLSHVWNYQHSSCMSDESYLDKLFGEYREDFIEANNNPKIIHYDSVIKPWICPNVISSGIFWNYARTSPFYEEILYKNINTKDLLKQMNISISLYINYYTLKYFIKYFSKKDRKSLKFQKKQLRKVIKVIRKVKRMRNEK